MPESINTFDVLNSKIIALNNASTRPTDILLKGLDVADEIMHIIGIPYNQIEKGEEMLEKAFPNSQFRNQKVEKWFYQNPIIDQARVALNHYDKDDYPIESKFYMLSDTPRKEKIAYATQLFPNWEDSELYMLPQYKVGIDFFLCPKTKSLLFVVTRKGALRVCEFSEKLTHTQIEILNIIQNCAIYTQSTIHETLWKALELKAVNKKFYFGIAEHFTLLYQHLKEHIPSGVDPSSIDATSKIYANRIINRLLFVWFLRKKRIINEDYNYFDIGNADSADYYENKLKPLFFNTLNVPVEDREPSGDTITPYLNGGLFEAHESDWYDTKVSFPSNWFNTLYEHLEKFNFTTDESSAEYEQIAIDPEMLGRVFENLLASIVSETANVANERNNKGAFYTPREIVSYMCKISLKEYLKRNVSSEKFYEGIDKLIDLTDDKFLSQKSTGQADLWGVNSTQVREQLAEAINKLKILDPACGSGAFPIGMLQLLLKTCDRLSLIYDEKKGKMRLISGTEVTNTYQTKLFIIQNCLYGVDIEPMAAEISRLRAWLSLIIDNKKENIEPLPNLDFNFICANSLVKLPEQYSLFESEYEKQFQELRNEYFNAHNKKDKDLLRKRFYKLYEENDEEGPNNRFEMMRSWDPFQNTKPADFFDSQTMFNVQKFPIVIGNPPYVKLEKIEKYRSLYGSQGYKSYAAKGDMYYLFIERGIDLCTEKGALTYITSNKWMKAIYADKLRNYISTKNPILLIDFGSTKVFDSATVDTNIIQIVNEPNKKNTIACNYSSEVAERENIDNINSYVQLKSSAKEFYTSEPWIIVFGMGLSIKEKIETRGTPLQNWNIINKYGIKTGSKFFTINKEKRDEILSNCKSADEKIKTDSVIRPLLEGKDIKRYGYKWNKKYLINFHNGLPKRSIPALNIEDYPSLKNYFRPYYNDLASRTDHGQTPYNLRDCAYLEEIDKEKLVYTVVNSEYRFSLVPENYIVNNSLFMIIGDDIDIICALCNSSLIRFYLHITLSNDSYQYGSKDYFETLPLLKNIDCDKKNKLKKLVREASDEGNEQAVKDIDEIIFELYGISEEERNYINTVLNRDND